MNREQFDCLAAQGRDALGRLVRTAFVEWHRARPHPKPSMLVPYDDLDAEGKDLAQAIGIAIGRFFVDAQLALATTAASHGYQDTHRVLNDLVSRWVQQNGFGFPFVEDALRCLAANQLGFPEMQFTITPELAERARAALQADAARRGFSMKGETK